MNSTAPAPMLTLLERLIAYAASRRQTVRGHFTLETVKFAPDAVQLDVVAQGLTFLVNGRYTADAIIQSTDPAETHCSVQLTAGRTAGRLAQSLSRFLPDAWVNVLLAELLPGVRQEGHAYVVSHRVLARALLGLSSLA